MRTAVERRDAILDTLCVRRQDTYQNLSREFGVSFSTIRRDIEVLACSYPIEPTRGRYGGGVKIADWYHRDRSYLSTEQSDLLERLAHSLEGRDLEVMNSILSKFAPYKTTERRNQIETL